MNSMRYDAMALGEGDLQILGVSAIQQRIEEADFPVLSANVFLAGTDRLLTRPYVVREVGGHRIAIIGLTGHATLPGVEIRDALETAQESVDLVREHADILILLSHAGLALNRQIAQELHELNLIISGGGQELTAVPEFTDGGPVLVHADSPSPGHAGRRIGVGTWYFDADGRLTQQNWRSVALTPDMPDDPAMLEWVRQHP